MADRCQFKAGETICPNPTSASKFHTEYQRDVREVLSLIRPSPQAGLARGMKPHLEGSPSCHRKLRNSQRAAQNGLRWEEQTSYPPSPLRLDISDG